MNDTKLKTPRIIGSFVMTAVMLIGIYVLIVNNKPDQAATKAVTQTTSANANVNKPRAQQSADAPSSSGDSATTSQSTTADQPSQETPQVDTPTTKFKNGTYTASASYDVPRHTNGIKVTISVSNDVITAVSATYSYDGDESVRYINGFDSGLAGAVVGKKLDAAQVGHINGSSDTSEGYNEALSVIINQATNS